MTLCSAFVKFAVLKAEPLESAFPAGRLGTRRREERDEPGSEDEQRITN